MLNRQFELLGITVGTGTEIRWRRDYASGRETGLDYFRRIPYLDANRAGDHKIIWELNRHQHLVALAQAFLLTSRSEYLEDLWRLLESWLEQNPFCRGMNWTSALEVAFRSLSWIWIEHLVGAKMPEPLRRRWLPALFDHGRFLERNLSVYFSPNTHLQGEALALHALGVLFSKHPVSRRWRRRGAAVLAQIIHTHVRPDGGHFEQSSYYHVYATDMFLFHALLEPVPASYLNQLRKMARYAWALASQGDLPLFGDDDGGRLFHPFGVRRRFVRGALATCFALLGDTPWHGDPQDHHDQALWWLGQPDSPPFSPAVAESSLFPDTGVAVLANGGVHAVVDTRAFGFGGAGHSHAHALHFTLKKNGADVLLDPGAYTYVADPVSRDRFRATAAHNTVRIDRLDQASPAGPFRWTSLPETQILQWSAHPWRLDAVCKYRGLSHRRRMAWAGQTLFVLDQVEGSGVHRLEQCWHPAGPVRKLGAGLLELPGGVFLVFEENAKLHIEEGGEFGWESPAPGLRIQRPWMCVEKEASLPCFLPAAFFFGANPPAGPLTFEQAPGSLRLAGGDSEVTWSL